MKLKDIKDILAEIDSLYEINDIPGVEKLFLESVREAKESDDDVMLLQLLNEMIGYYRVLSQRDRLLEVIDEAMEVANRLKLCGSVPYATTLLNAATGYRSIGELERAKECYGATEEIYEKNLEPDDMLFANLYNNISLMYQEKADYGNAMNYLLRAAEIAEKNEAKFETAVTYANLANTSVIAKQYECAKEYAKKSMAGFEEIKLYDLHYCAALSALGMCCYEEGDMERAKSLFERAMEIMEKSVGKSAQYERLKANRDMCMAEGRPKGLEICRRYYETLGQTMLREHFSEYMDRIAVGLVGEGSDCFGYDDDISMDHDWGPGFCMWVTDETYEEIGERLQQAYEELPEEFMGFSRGAAAQGQGRRGVIKISDFYKRLLGTDNYDELDWRSVEDYALAAATNGEVFTDPEGVFSNMRQKLQAGYPEHILYLKLAEDMAGFSQTGQYNYGRMQTRGDFLTADRMLSDCMGHFMKLCHHMQNVYPPHDKWLLRSMRDLDEGTYMTELVTGLYTCLKEKDTGIAADMVRDRLEAIGDCLANKLYAMNYISDINSYLDYHTDELLKKAGYSRWDDATLVDKIVMLEFRAFDKVKNENGRAYCQDDWSTFSVMRKSQYLTWNREMLLQYMYDFAREFEIGHNLITEKYGRMMESTAPERYRELEVHFPKLSEQKKAVIEQIVAVQMNMVEEFAKECPKVVGNARKLHTYEDDIIDTSYETYLRGEISTYSDKMLQLYGKYVVDCANLGINIARETIGNTAKLYGYGSLEEFEARIN